VLLVCCEGFWGWDEMDSKARASFAMWGYCLDGAGDPSLQLSHMILQAAGNVREPGKGVLTLASGGFDAWFCPWECCFENGLKWMCRPA